MLILFALISGLLSIEQLIWGQFLFSRPIIYIPFILFIFHVLHIYNYDFNFYHILFFIIAFFEFHMIFSIPLGNAFVPDSVIGPLSSVFYLFFIPEKKILSTPYTFVLIFYILTIVYAYIGGYIDVLIRKFDVFLVEYGKKQLLQEKFKKFEYLSIYGHLIFFLKGFITTLILGIITIILSKYILLRIIIFTNIEEFSIIFLISILTRFFIKIFTQKRLFNNSLFNLFTFLAIFVAILFLNNWGMLMLCLIFLIYMYFEYKKVKND